MASFTGPDSDAAIKSAGIEKNLSDLCECVKSLKIGFEDTGIPVDDDNVAFHRLCYKLEFLLTAGLRESSGVFSRAKTPWHYINACLARSKKVHDGIRFVRGVHELKTPAGKLRSFLRFCLAHQCLADTVQQCIIQEDVTSSYYSQHSLLARKDLVAGLVSTLYELSDVQHDLAPTGYDLDIGWPTFARKQFGRFNWKSSNLSGSRASLSFSFDSQSVSSFRSGLTSPLSPFMPGGMPSGRGTSVPFNSTMASNVSSRSNSPTGTDETDGLLATIRQLTDEKEEMAGKMDALAQQLDQERENGRNAKLRMDTERAELAEKMAAMEAIRQAEALARKMLAVRDGEVELLKAQLASTEAKLDAARERATLQKALIMEEVRQMAIRLAEAELTVNKWKETASRWAELDHPDDIRFDTLDGAEGLGGRLKDLLNEKKATAKELEAAKEANMSLVKALAQHGNRLSTVTNQLDQTWVELSKIKLEADKLQTDESVMRYELKEKRELLGTLKEQLERSRATWDRIRASNQANQDQWQSIRDELDGRRVEEQQQQQQPAFDLVSDIPPAVQQQPEEIHEEEEDGEPQPDGREERLRLMEEQCRALYDKMASTTSRNAQLVGRLASLQAHPCIARPGEHQRQETEGVRLADKESEVAVLQEELRAVKFDQAAKQLEYERNQQAYQRQEEELRSALDRIREGEELIGSLREELGKFSSRNRDERQEMETRVRQLELSLMTRNEECEGLVNELRSTVEELDQLRTAHKQLEEDLKASRAAETRMAAENQLFKEESVMLRGKIVQLVKEKDCLWKASDKLLHLHRVQATDQWLADGSIRECQGCRTAFTFFVRKHHCRLCGRIFCHSCSAHWLSIAASSRPERACAECFTVHTQFSRPDAADQLAVLPSDGEESLAKTSNEQTDTSGTGPAGFSVITDSEIVRSLSESSPYSASPTPLSGDGQPSDIRTAGIRPFELLLLSRPDEHPPTEAFLSPAMIFRVPLQVDRPGCTLHWQFKSDPKSIAFAVVGRSNEEQEDGRDEVLDRVIVETSLHKSEEDFVTGSAILEHSGLYYVYFDNSYSRFSANKVSFHLSLSLPADAS